VRQDQDEWWASANAPLLYDAAACFLCIWFSGDEARDQSLKADDPPKKRQPISVTGGETLVRLKPGRSNSFTAGSLRSIDILEL
jgi:hypothetical protein